MWHRLMEWKMPLRKWQTFFITPWLICCFVILSYIDRMWIFKTNLARILPLKSKLSEKFQRFDAVNGSIKMLKIVEFPKISMKNEKFKKFLSVSNSELLERNYSVPHVIKASLSLKQKFSNGDIQKYTDICFTITLSMECLGF